MSKRAVLLVAAILLLTTGFQQSKDKPTQPEKPIPKEAGGGVEESPGWSVFSPKSGRFSVMLPGTPTEMSLRIDEPGGPVTSPLYQLGSGEFRYLISHIDYAYPVKDPKEKDDIVKSAAEKAIIEAGGTVVSNKPISLGEYPGREVNGKVPGFLYQSHVYIVKERVYGLFLLMPADGSGAEKAAKFFDSFKVLPAEPGPAGSTP